MASDQRLPERVSKASGPTGEDLRVIGKARQRVDARGKVTGQTVYADDISLPRMTYCKLLRSPHPHARIRSIDISRAAARSGVYLVLTGKDLPIEYGILPVSQDETALCVDRVRHVGDPVAAVIAREELTAFEALDLIAVEYEILPTISSPEEALATPEPRIHDYGEEGNIHKRVSFEFGDVDKGFAEADEVLEDLFFYAGSNHLAMEQHASVAVKDREGKLTLWTSTQVPHYLHRALAKVLEMPAAHIRVIATPNGGGFGGKSDPLNHEIIVSKAAMLLGRPVKISLTREEVFYCHRGRHPVLMKFKTGVKKDGTITALDLQTLIDGGGYGSFGVASTFYTGALQTTAYHVPKYKFRACRTFTNKPPCGPKRGHGTPQPRFGQEVQMDKIAERLGMDPAELRLRVAVKPNELTANFLQLGTVGLEECIRRVVEMSGWNQKFRKLPEGRGVGLACSCYLTGAGLSIYWNKMPHSGIQLKLDRSGGVTLQAGTTEIGQGSDDVLAAIVAETLGLRTADIRVYSGDTDLGPVDLGSYSSRVTLMAGNAAMQAAERAKAMLAEPVAEKLQTTKERLRFADGAVFDTAAPEKRVTFAEAVCLGESRFGTIGTVGSYWPPKMPAAQYKGGGVGTSPTYTYSVAVAEVDVNPATGWLRVVRIWNTHDIGRTLNPTIALGQVEGSIYMGLGEALMEEQDFRRLPKKLSHALVHKAPSMLDYKSPTSLEMPEIFTEFVEGPDPRGPFGAKEVGQGPLLPIAPAVANAVYDAVGVRIDEVPITPEKILKALAEKKAGRAPRYGPTQFPNVTWPEALRVPPPWDGGDGHAINEAPRAPKPDGEKEKVLSR
ncbi:MAG TPA: molybdopterin cofactor-binding domain-containing protein [Candidatus Dormibacteraeota bacterium]|nr:molybdopterin cofactor-binding domain-containing protein [Candidatus Dormibacteraeota bacterium]